MSNATGANSTNVTGPTPVGFTTVNIPVLHLFMSPSDDFAAVVNNVTHVTAEMPATQLGLKGLYFLLSFVGCFLSKQGFWGDFLHSLPVKASKAIILKMSMG